MSKYRTTPVQQTKMPGGIPFIIGNEVAERFSFYGMKGILTIFMTKYLLDQTGALDTFSDEQAKSTYHLFTAAAYFFPIVGAVISDVLLGKYLTILTLSLLYCVGHGCLAVMDIAPAMLDMHMKWWLYAGLLFIAMGAGAIKPCVSAHVGDQFGAKNKHLIPKIFSWFYFSINVGAATSTILTPLFLELVGPWLAFGVPGVLMAIATFVFWLGRNRFVHVPASGPKKFAEETFSTDGRRALLYLAPLFLIFIPMFWALFDQTGSAWVLQADKMDRTFAGVRWLPSQIQAANPILILILIPVFTYLIYPALGKILPMTPLRRMSIGMFVTVIAFSTSGLIEENINGGAVIDVSSMSTAERWQQQSILDGPVDGFGWASARIDREADEIEPQEITIRLREYRSWMIDGVELDPYTVRGKPEETNKKAHEAWDDMEDEQKQAWENEPDRENWARDVTVLVRNKRTEDSGEQWNEIGSIELAQTNELQRMSFDPVEASHVKLRIESNWGGDYFKLGRARVLAANDYQTAATRFTENGGDVPAQPEIWPDVAGLGFKPNIGWQFLAYVIITAAEIMVSITSLEFAYTQAPKRMKSFIMGVYFLGVSLGNLFTAAVNHFIQNEDGSSKLQGPSYYWFFTAIMGITAVLFVFFAAIYRGRTYIQGEAPMDEQLEAEAEAEATDSR